MVIRITQPPPKEGAQNVLLHSNPDLSTVDILLNNALRAPSLRRGCVIPITVPYKDGVSVF